jgi:hypothetical protein
MAAVVRDTPFSGGLVGLRFNGQPFGDGDVLDEGLGTVHAIYDLTLPGST